jgi:ABC-type nitrate/sulfonate/bicarbonate transport system substrate-binding protein
MTDSYNALTSTGVRNNRDHSTFLAMIRTNVDEKRKHLLEAAVQASAQAAKDAVEQAAKHAQAAKDAAAQAAAAQS